MEEPEEEEEEGEGSLESFLKWGAELGITDNPSDDQHLSSSSSSFSCLGQALCISHFPDAGGRGLAAARDLKRGELILKVPKSALITTHTLINDDKLSLALYKHSSLSCTQALTVCLLYEVGKGKSSSWYRYLMQLPRSYDILASFGPFEIQSLQANIAIWAAEKTTEKVELDWKEALSIMEELHLKRRLRTFRAWLWAFATISSRTLHVPWDNAGCLCPVGDLFNYEAPGDNPEEAFYSKNSFVYENSSSWKSDSFLLANGDIIEQSNLDVNLLRLTDAGYVEDVSAYCFYARKDYNKGEQVLLSYGTYTNLELLEHYGFLLDTNPNDKAFIPLQPEIYSSCSWPKDSLFIHQNGNPSFALHSALRLWLTPPNQRRSFGHLVYSGIQLSSMNEMIVMQWIEKNCRVILENFPTSIEEDKLLLHSIDKLQDSCTFLDHEGVLLSCKGEVFAFLENKGWINGESGVKFLESRKIRRCIGQWKLAVQWRLGYKRTLVDCISYCAKVMDELPSENDAMR